MSLPDRLDLAARATSLSVSDAARLLSAEVRSRRECLQIISSLIDATARLDGDSSQSKQQFAP
jgi:hypothetical protein